MNTSQVYKEKIDLISWISQLQNVSVLSELRKIQGKYSTESQQKKEILHDLRQAVEEVNLARQGKIKLQTAKDFLNEL